MNEFASFPINRPRRLRLNGTLREILQECHLRKSDLIYPVFVVAGEDQKQAIPSIPGQYRFSPDILLGELREAYALGIKSFALFPVIDTPLKNARASEALNPTGLIPQVLEILKRELPEAIVIVDIALDPYTDHGHDGLVDPVSGSVLNDETLAVLRKMALMLAESGADIVAPSDMMDGRVMEIRSILDAHGRQDTLILSYAAKYASAFYGPFRSALGSALQQGDKLSYQLNPANAMEAEKELLLDQIEGADLLMVKPGLPYLDMLYRATQICHLPVFAYQVSGEYSMLRGAIDQGWLDERKAVLESLLCFKRAGASAILTYFAKQVAGWL